MHPEQASIQFNTHIGPKYSIEERWKLPWEWETQKVTLTSDFKIHDLFLFH